MTLRYTEWTYMAIAIVVALFFAAMCLKSIIEFDVDITVFPPRIHISFKKREKEKTTEKLKKKSASK